MTLNDRKAGQDVILIHGESYDLPEDNAHVQSLVAQGLLTVGAQEKPLVPAAVETPKVPRKGRKSNK